MAHEHTRVLFQVVGNTMMPLMPFCLPLPFASFVFAVAIILLLVFALSVYVVLRCKIFLNLFSWKLSILFMRFLLSATDSRPWTSVDLMRVSNTGSFIFRGTAAYFQYGASCLHVAIAAVNRAFTLITGLSVSVIVAPRYVVRCVGGTASPSAQCLSGCGSLMARRARFCLFKDRA